MSNISERDREINRLREHLAAAEQLIDALEHASGRLEIINKYRSILASYDETRGQVDRLKKRLSDSFEALVAYGTHNYSCECFVRGNHEPIGSSHSNCCDGCTCGLASALYELSVT